MHLTKQTNKDGSSAEDRCMVWKQAVMSSLPFSPAGMPHVTSIKVVLDKFEELLLPYDSRPICFTLEARD
jgi:hypothetical protein